jgi:hypothetical protein
MAGIPPLSIASSTAPNWLKEAQDAIEASKNSGGMLGALQDSRYPGSIKNFLSKSQNSMANFALIVQGSTTSATQLALQMADAANQKRAAEKQAQLQKFNAVPVNYNPPRELDQFIYFDDGSSIDTVNNILTRSDGSQIDTTTGTSIIDSASIINLANGAYIDTKNNIMTLVDGTKIDTLSGLKITA